uniref:Glycerophosphodiester phosphodiesterase domain-containing protein 3-like n=1 Tax=Pundamilia nyererei TaxID=303518 RepID=A0A3B4GM23_9CICH
MINFLYFFLPVLGGYTLTSVYLLKNPQILHRKKRPAFYCKKIAHRGGSGERIESTMEAFTHAAEQGTEMLEMDCHLTHDGFVVVSHDENLLRQTGHDVTISSLNLQVRSRILLDWGKGRYSTGKDRKFALLEDVFKKFPEMPISIEIKENNHELIKRNGSMPYSFTMSRGLLLLLLFYTGLLPFVPIGESLLQFYLMRIFNRCDCRSVITMRKSLFRHLAARGIQVHLFVCNTEEDIEAALEVGATGVMSDYPTLLSSYFCKNRSQD